MKNIHIPKTAEAYVADLHERALPDSNLTANDFYRRLIGWVLDVRTPLLYEQDHDDEYTNFSINFNWLLLRDYGKTHLGPGATIATMYGLHELTHMTHDIPTKLDEVSAEKYADEFTRSEYRASNETEILVHYRIPGLRSLVFPGMKIAFDILRERGIHQPSMKLLCALRQLVVEHDVLDSFFQGDHKNQEILERFKKYTGNRHWAVERFSAIQPYFVHPDFRQACGLTDAEYEGVISTYEPNLAQDTYEANVIRNVRFGFAMCGLEVPLITDFKQARQAAKQLEGHHAIVQS